MAEEAQENGIILRLNFRTALIFVILAFVLFTRLYRLQEKALMHDECMFAYYSLYLAESGDYLYRPILHGPILQDMNALMFLVFGKSTYVMRLFPALCGIGLFAILFALRKRLGRVGLVAALAFFALSPFLMFYARFCRNDMPFALTSMLILYCYWKFFKDGKGWTLVFAIISSMLLICIKENQLIFFFTFFTFAGIMFLVDVIKGMMSRKNEDTEEKEKDKNRKAYVPGLSFVPDPLSVICLVAGVVIYTVGLHAHYYALRLLGFMGIVLYFAIIFKKYHRFVRENPDKTSFGGLSFVTVFVNSFALVFFTWILYLDLFSGLSDIVWTKVRILILFLIYYNLLFFMGMIIRKKWGEENLFRKFFLKMGDHYVYIIIGLAAACAVYIIVFTTFFKHPESPMQIYKKTFEYWMGQHKEHRIKGPFHYYLPILAVYDLPMLFIVLVGTVAACWKEKWVRFGPLLIYAIIMCVFGLYFLKYPISKETFKKLDGSIHMSNYFHLFLFFSVAYFGTVLTVLYLWRKERFTALLVYWSMGSFLGYSYAGEKVPWVSVHIVLPMLLLSAIYIKKLWETKFFHRTRIAWYVLFSLFALWNLKSAMIVSFVNHSNIAERMIYSHAPMDVPRCAEEVERIAFQLGTKKETQILVKGWAVWPMRWYLHGYKWSEWEKPETTKYPIVIMDYKDAMAVDNIKDNYHIAKHHVIQWWTPAMLDFNRLGNIWKAAIPEQYTKDKAFGQDIENSKEEWMKIWNYMIHREAFQAHDAKWPSISRPEIAFCVRKGIYQQNPGGKAE